MRPADTNTTTPAVPVHVPLLLLVIDQDGTLTATLDGRPVDPPTEVQAWRRSLFGQIIDHVTDDRATPVRVEVHESDGSTFTDILPATRRPKKDTTHSTPPATKKAKKHRSPAPVRVESGDGFIAGEDVAVALITGHTDATPHGHATGLIDPDLIAKTKASEVVLVGRVSGTISVRSLS